MSLLCLNTGLEEMMSANETAYVSRIALAQRLLEVRNFETQRRSDAEEGAAFLVLKYRFASAEAEGDAFNEYLVRAYEKIEEDMLTVAEQLAHDFSEAELMQLIAMFDSPLMRALVETDSKSEKLMDQADDRTVQEVIDASPSDAFVEVMSSEEEIFALADVKYKM